MDFARILKEHFDQSEWKPVIGPTGRNYWEGFRHDREYDFRRFPDEEIFAFKLSSQNEFFNIAGLYWRTPNSPTERT